MWRSFRSTRAQALFGYVRSESRLCVKLLGIRDADREHLFWPGIRITTRLLGACGAPVGIYQGYIPTAMKERMLWG